MARRRRSLPETPERKPDKTDLYAMWEQRVARAIKQRTDWEIRFKVEKAEQYFLGEQDGANAYNHLAATTKTNRANLFFQMPKFFVRPTPKRNEPATDSTVAIGEGVLESIAQQDDHLAIAGNLAVLQAFFRIGVLKICYDPRMEPNPKKGEVIYDNRGGEPVLVDGEPVPMRDPLTGKPLVEPAEVLTDEVYRWRWVDASNMLLPDAGPDVTAWPWIGEEVVVPLDDAKEDTRFPEKMRQRLRSNISSREAKDKRRTQLAPGVEEWFKYNECYDIRKKRWYVWADGQDFEDFLVEEPLQPWIDNDPYAVLILGEPVIGPDPSPWPKPVVRDWVPVQSEYNIRRQQANEGCKRAARKVIYGEGAFADEDEATKVLQSPDDMEAAKGDVNKVKVLEVPPLNADIWKDLLALQNDWRIITHQTGARLADPDAGTATEAAFTERAANLVDSDMQAQVIRWMAAAGRKMLQALRETLTLGMWVAIRELTDAELQQYVKRVYGIDPLMLKAYPALKDVARQRVGEQKWQRVSRTQLQFEADVTVVPGSTRPRNLDNERRNWLEFLKIIAVGPQLALSRELLRYTAEKFDINDDRLLDEMVALAEKMIAVNSNQAGRGQGSTTTNGNGTTATGDVLSMVTGGSR